jgi:replicative DNA helicase
MERKTSSIRLGYKNPVFSASDINEGIGKIPPQALEIEEAVLGALMLEKDALSTVIDILKPESFYKDSHQEIYPDTVQ